MRFVIKNSVKKKNTNSLNVNLEAEKMKNAGKARAMTIRVSIYCDESCYRKFGDNKR